MISGKSRREAIDDRQGKAAARTSRSFLSVWACLIALVIAALNYALWAWGNRPAEFVDWDAGGVKGFAYTGFQRNQDPRQGSYPTEEQIRSDMKLLARHTNRIRTYATGENEKLPEIA